MLAVAGGPDNVEVLYVWTLTSEAPTKTLPVDERVCRCQEVVMDPDGTDGCFNARSTSELRFQATSSQP